MCALEADGCPCAECGAEHNPSNLEGKVSRPASDTSRAKSDTKSTCLLSPGHSGSGDRSVKSLIPGQDHEQVPCDEFELQVRELCLLLWPASNINPTEKPFFERIGNRLARALRVNGRLPSEYSLNTAERFVIEKLRGGSYNRVVGVTRIINGQFDKAETRMILRVPRWNMSRPDHDVTMLQFVRKHALVPVPEVLAHDFTGNNPLRKPYVFQSRIAGHDLESKARSYPHLSHEQKIMFVKEFCQILVNMQGVEHEYAGKVETDTDDRGAQIFTVCPFDVGPESEELIAKRSVQLPFFKPRSFPADTELLSNSTDKPIDKTPHYFFLTQFGRWKHLQLELNPAEIGRESILDRLVTAANQMEELGYLDCDCYCLTHYDLDPRNIMVDIQLDGILKISGILDWDLAMFAPKWVSCKPPMWIWNWLDGGSEEETKANDEPQTAEQQELKELFEEYVGFDFTWYAYQPHYRLARQLFRLAMYGLTTVTLHDDAERFLAEWAGLHESEQAEDHQGEKEGLNDVLDPCRDAEQEKIGGD
ncbi:hypothetical protein MMC28_011100 [Mycoblastus sanguinarius]|nr:hypothetical protein [Mycoblastus sanguinarius]